MHEQCGVIAALSCYSRCSFFLVLKIILSKSILTNLWGSSEAILLCMFLSPVDASSDGLYIYLARVSAALLRVVRRDGFSSHNVYTRLLARITSDRFFYKFYFNTLYIYLCWILSHAWSGQSLEGSILGGPFEAQYLNLYRRGLQNCWQIFLIVTTISELFVLPYILVSLHSCLWVSDTCTLIWRRFLGLFIVPYFLVTAGAPKNWRNCFVLVRGISGSLFPAFFLNRPLTKTVLAGCLHYIQRSFWRSHLSSCSVRRRGRNRGNRINCW